MTLPSGGPNRLGDFSVYLVQKKAPLKPNIVIGSHVVHRHYIVMQSMLSKWVESKVPSVMHHVDQNHMDIIPYGWMTWILEKKSKATEKFVASVA